MQLLFFMQNCWLHSWAGDCLCCLLMGVTSISGWNSWIRVNDIMALWPVYFNTLKTLKLFTASSNSFCTLQACNLRMSFWQRHVIQVQQPLLLICKHLYNVFCQYLLRPNKILGFLLHFLFKNLPLFSITVWQVNPLGAETSLKMRQKRGQCPIWCKWNHIQIN